MRSERGFALAIVLWAIAITAIVLSATQISAWRQAASGRETLGQIRAKWAARAGVEQMIATLQSSTRTGTPVSTKDLLARFAQQAEGQIFSASYAVLTGENGRPVPGVGDAHAKLNVNLLTQADLLLLPNMTEELAAGILDWIDDNEDTRSNGAEADVYASLASAYEPRNFPVQRLSELELVSKVDRTFVRGLDENLDGWVDATEADSETLRTITLTDLGWSGILTASSVSGGLSSTGEARLDLATASAGDVASAAGVDSAQGEGIVSWAKQPNANLADFIRADLSTLATRAFTAEGRTGRNRPPIPANLTRTQLTALLDTCWIGDPASPWPGKLNINTAPREVFDYISALDPTTREALVAFRDSSAGQIESIADLLDVAGMSRNRVATLSLLLDVRSNVFEFTSVGRDETTGLSVELRVELDRSTLPVTIRSMVQR
jgi:type II secretory pathway component PulK